VARKTRASRRRKEQRDKQDQQRDPSAEASADELAAPPAKAPKKVRPSRRAVRQPVKQESDWVGDVVPLCIGIACALLPTMVQPGLRDLYQLPKTFAMTYAAAWGLLGLGVITAMGSKLRVPDIPLKWPLLGMIGSIAIGVSLAPDETGGVLSIFAKMDAYRWAAGLVLLALGLVSIRAPRHLLYILIGMIAGGLFVSIVGIGQHHNLRALLPAGAEKWKGINFPGSSFGNRNMAAQQVVAVFSAALVFFGMGVRWWRRNKATPALVVSIPAAGSLFLLLYYLRLSVTRSAWGGALIGLVLGGILYLVARMQGSKAAAADSEGEAGDKPKRSATPIVAGVLAVTLLGGVIASQKMGQASYDKGVGDQKRQMGIVELASTAFDFDKPHWDMRFMMWSTTVEAIKARPIGGGAGNWRVLYPQHVTRREKNDHFTIAKQPVRAHQDFLQFASEYGLQGLLSLLGLIFVGFFLTVKTVALSRRPELDHDDGAHWMALAALAGVMGITAICVDACFSFPFQLPAPTFVFCIWVAVIGAAWMFVRTRLDEHELAAAGGKGAVIAPDEDAESPDSPAVRKVAELITPPPGIRLALLAAGIMAVGFVHWENSRLLKAEVGFTQGRGQQKRRNPAGGLVQINTALSINADDFQNHFIQALCYNSMGKMKEAVASIEASLALYPNLLNAWVNLAMFSARLGDDAKMNHAIQQALALKPDEPYALNVRAEWLRRRGQHAQIVKELEPHLGNTMLNGAYNGKANTRYLRNLLKAYEATGAWARIPRVYGYLIDWYPLTDYTSANARRRYRTRWQKLHNKQTARYKRDVANYYEKSGDAWTKAGKHCEAVKPFGAASARAKLSKPAVKKKYAPALIRCGKSWPKALHEMEVALSVDRHTKADFIGELDRMRGAASGADKEWIGKLKAVAVRW